MDLAKTSPRDSMIWVLAPDGNDGLLRIRLTEGSQLRRRETRSHYGRWSIARDENGAALLCINRRPGREPPSCTTFRLDSLPADSGGRERLTVFAYRGAHHTGERVLLRRQR